MTTTDQRTERTAGTGAEPADPADASGWAVPGVGPRRPVLSAAESDRTDRPKDLRTEIADSVGV
ncbi:MAG TPA: hypothetical protein VK204_00840, partial [Nocardioidaceae bacterium]|nr:hypothetical protein [Nocardioidaceae bacterium]